MSERENKQYPLRLPACSSSPS